MDGGTEVRFGVWDVCYVRWLRREMVVVVEVGVGIGIRAQDLWCCCRKERLVL